MAKTTFFSSLDGSVSSSATNLFSQEFLFQEHLTETKSSAIEYFALLEFEKPVVCPVQSKVIGSRLDSDAFSNKCRIAFHGFLIKCFTKKDYEMSILPQIRIFKPKRREGCVDRVCELLYSLELLVTHYFIRFKMTEL